MDGLSSLKPLVLRTQSSVGRRRIQEPESATGWSLNAEAAVDAEVLVRVDSEGRFWGWNQFRTSGHDECGKLTTGRFSVPDSPESGERALLRDKVCVIQCGEMSISISEDFRGSGRGQACMLCSGHLNFLSRSAPWNKWATQSRNICNGVLGIDHRYQHKVGYQEYVGKHT